MGHTMSVLQTGHVLPCSGGFHDARAACTMAGGSRATSPHRHRDRKQSQQQKICDALHSVFTPRPSNCIVRYETAWNFCSFSMVRQSVPEWSCPSILERGYFYGCKHIESRKDAPSSFCDFQISNVSGGYLHYTCLKAFYKPPRRINAGMSSSSGCSSRCAS